MLKYLRFLLFYGNYINFHVDKGLHLDSILSRMIPFQFRPPYSGSIRFNIVLTSASSYLAIRFSDRHIVNTFLIFSVSTTLSVFLILVILMMFVEQYELRSSSCRRYLQSLTSKYPPQSPETSLSLTYKHCTSLLNYEQNSGFVYLTFINPCSVI